MAGVQVIENYGTTDNDVEAEKERINKTPAASLLQTNSLIIKNLTKYYGNFRAVNNISVSIPANECFGLLGQNGAWKTTIFKSLTGEERSSVGDAYLQGCSINDNIREVHKKLGYCPQFDGLIDQLTGRETLTMSGRLRGVLEHQISDIVTELIEVMMLREHADKQTAFYSMEECEALCTKIVIMVNAEFVCIGSTQHQKTKCSQGFSLLCRMKMTTEGKSVPVKPLISFMQQNFPSAQVFDDKQGFIHFQIPDQNTRLGHIFARMEESKESFGVDDYSVHQTSLEQIFLAFTRNQVPPVKAKRGFWTCCKCQCCT